MEEANKKLAQGKFFLSLRPLTNATEELCLSVRLSVCLYEASVVIGFILVYIFNNIHIYCSRLHQIINDEIYLFKKCSIL